VNISTLLREGKTRCGPASPSPHRRRAAPA